MPLMRDGFKTLLGFGGLPGVLFQELTVKPPGWDGRGPIDVTNMRNTAFTTKWPSSLVDVTNTVVTVHWDPDLFAQVRNTVLLINQLLTVRFPTGRGVQFYGWLDKLEPDEHKEHNVPVATMTIVCSNLNGIGVEIAPAMFGGQ